MKVAKRIIYSAAIILVLGSVYLLGVTKGYYQRITAYNFGTVFNNELSGYEEAVPNFVLYETVVNLVKDKYYGDVNYLDLLYGSIKGAVFSLGDPYTSFTTPEENREFFTNLNGIYEGIGIEIDFVEDKLVIIAPLEGSPADEAGLLPQDEIIGIDGMPVMGSELLEVIDLIKGARGTQITLTIIRDGEDIQEFTITRSVVRIKSVYLDVQDNIAVMRITKFGNDTEKLFNQEVRQIISKNIQGVILDLRNNPGGFLDVGVQVANEFLDGGVIVEERFKGGKIVPFSADGEGELSHLPVVVLVNGGSASAAEIVAGALRDNNRAVIVGERTYGKGSVQEVEEFADGSALRITIAHWFTPLGISISEEGINPDILITDGNDDSDVQLDRAIQELNKMIDESNLS